MRKRKRPEYTQRVLKYWARPIGELPQEFWDTAKAMRDLWNQFVVLRDCISAGTKEMDKTERDEIWKQSETWMRWLVRASGLNWECGPMVVDRFRTAVSTAAKKAKAGFLPAEQGWPNRHGRLERIVIPHRWTGGGAEVDALFSTKAKRISLQRVSEDAYSTNRRESRRARWTRGTFGVGAASFEFEMILHRPIPPDAIIKNVSWSGVFHRSKGWQWSLLIQIEEPATAVSISGRPECGLDLGWRRMGSRIRVAVLSEKDKDWLEEISIPLQVSNFKSRRHGLPSGWADEEEYLSKMGNLTEQMKTAVKSAPRPDLSGPVKTWLAHVGKVREGGLWRLRRMLRESGEWPEMLVDLDAWSDKYEKLRSFKLQLSDRLIRWRTQHFRSEAARMCRTYSRIYIEDVNLHKLAQVKPEAGEFALKHSGRFRKWAAPGEFRLLLKQYARKYETDIVLMETAHSTDRCATCGAYCQSAAELVTACPNGHVFDQDVNAAENISSQTWPESKPKKGLRKPSISLEAQA
jgi:hypothetical protein